MMPTIHNGAITVERTFFSVYMKAQIWKVYSCVLLTGVMCLSSTQAQQVLAAFGVSKTGYYVQTEDGPPVPEAGENHYFEVFVEADPLAEIDGAYVTRPTGGQLDLTQFLFYFEGFTSQAALDSQFGNGNYTFQVTTSDSDIFLGQLSLSGAYPTVPRLINYTAAQSINAGSEFSLRWEAIAGGTASDFVLITVDDADGLSVFTSPEFGAAGAVTGTDTAVTVPANTFKPGSNYVCYLTFTRFTDIKIEDGAQGTATFIRETSVPLRAATGGGALSANFTAFGRLQNGTCQFQISGTAGATL